MKKVITILMILVLCFSFAVIASAEKTENGGWEKENSKQNSNNEELRAYIEEKIVPVIIGVITSILALLGSLKGVFAALKELKKAKDDFKETSVQIKQSSESSSNALRIDYNAIKDSVKNVPELLDAIKAQDEKIEKLGDTVVIATEILALAYSANSELVKTGKAKEMNRLLRKLAPTGARKEVAEDETI